MKNSFKRYIGIFLSVIMVFSVVIVSPTYADEKTKTENHKKMSKEFKEKVEKEKNKVAKKTNKTDNFKHVEVNKSKGADAKPEYKKDEVIVKFKSNKVQTLNGKEKEVAGIKLKKEENIGKKGAQLYKIPENKTVENVVKELKNSPDVLYAEPNYKITANDVNDPYFDSLWGLENKGQYVNGYYGTPDIDINVPSAWNITEGSGDIVIAVIDTGIDINHPDLKYRIYKNKKEVPNNGVDDDSNGYIDDVNGWDFYNYDNTVYDSPYIDDHGTHVAGTIAGQSNNAVGVAGVAPKVKILPLKILGTSEGGGYVSDAVRAVEYATSMGVKISNNSWGGGSYSTALYEAIRDSGSLFVAAAGNDGYNNDYYYSYPASYNLDNILSVAAIGNRGELAYFSNYGSTTVDVAAPGVSILSTMPDNSYAYLDGTSMASPHVTGVAALVYSNNTSYTPTEIKSKIINSTKELDSVKYLVASGGMVDAARALGIVPDDDLPGIKWEGSSVNGSLDDKKDINDVYSIELVKGQQITARLIGGKSKDFDLYLYGIGADTVNSSGGIVAHSEKTGNVVDSFTYVVPYTGTYYLNAYAFKGVGSYKLEVTVSSAKKGYYQDTNDMLLYDGIWETYDSSLASGKTYTSTNNSYSSVEFNFEGKGIAYYGQKDSKQGIAKVTLDNEVTYVDLYSSKSGYRQKLFSKTGLSDGTHTIKIEWTGKASKSGKKTATNINVDLLQVLN